MGLGDLKAALRAKDDPVCRYLSTNTITRVISYTAGSMVYELSDKPQLHLAAGPPSESEFLTYQLSK